MPVRRFKVLVCRGPECGDRRGSQALSEAFAVALHKCSSGPDHVDVSLETQSCFGRCTIGPNVLVREIPDGGEAPRGFATLPGPRGVTALYNRVDVARVHRIVDAHIVGGRVVREFIEKPPASLPVVSAAPEPTSTTTVESISPLLVPSDSGDRNA